MDALKALLKQPYWVIALVFGVALVGFPCLTVDTDYHLTLHPPTTLLPVVVWHRIIGAVFNGLWIPTPGETYERRECTWRPRLEARHRS